MVCAQACQGDAINVGTPAGLREALADEACRSGRVMLT
jgi:hypothetical protein